MMISPTPIFTIHAELGEIRHFGQTPYGERRVIDILGGRIDGPRLQGRILPGADWQIVRPDGQPIPRLYSAGELGSIYSYLYQGTGNIGECLAFGRISGRNAVAEKPWE